MAGAYGGCIGNLDSDRARFGMQGRDLGVEKLGFRHKLVMQAGQAREF
jgi:hypothetical protein